MDIQNTESSASSAGYKYQDLVALEKIVELLTNVNMIEVVIDKSNTPHIEDVVINYSHYIEYIQIKHSNSKELSTFKKSDMFSNEKSLFSKTFIGWKTQRDKGLIKVVIVTNDKVSIHKSNKSSLKDIVQEIKNFQQTGKINDSILTILQDDLKKNNKSPKNKAELKKFLKDLYFTFKYPSRYELLNNIKLKLQKIIQTDYIDNYLHKLYTTVSLSATEASEEKRTFTKQRVESILNIDKKPHFTHFYDIPDNYIHVSENSLNLQKAYENLSQGYIFLKGSAGSGKTTFITKFLSEEHKKNNIAVLRYYLFHFDDKLHEDSSDRVKKNFFYYDLSLQLKKYLENEFIGAEYLNKDHNNYNTFWKNLELLKSKYNKVIVIVDGIDHAIRASNSIETLFNGLKTPNEIPNNIVFILSGQPNWDDYPSWLKGKDSLYFKPINIKPFTIDLCQKYIHSLQYWYDDNLVDYISQKSFEVTNGYPLNLKVFLKSIKKLSSKEEIKEYLQQEKIFDDLHIYYGRLFDDIKNSYFKENTQNLLKFQALLYLLRQPISSEVVSEIFTSIDIFEFEEIITKIGPILEKVKESSYELFHNDVRVYLKDKITEPIKKTTIKQIANYYLQNLEDHYSQQYLLEYLEYLEDYKSIEKLLTFERLDLKYKLLRDNKEIESEFKIGRRVAQKLKKPIFILQVLLLGRQHETLLDNLIDSEFDDFDVEPHKNDNNDLYSYIAPAKNDLSPSAMRTREDFYDVFIESNISSVETKKYFFHKFSFNVLEYIEKLNKVDIHPFSQNEFIGKYFLVHLMTNREASILELNKIQKLENINNKIQYITEDFFEVYLEYFGSNLDIVELSKNYGIKFSNKSVIDLILQLHRDNKVGDLRTLLHLLSDKKSNILKSNEVIYIMLLNQFHNFLPDEYHIEPLSENKVFELTEDREVLFRWAYLKTYQEKLQEPSILFQALKKDRYRLYGINKITIWLGFLSIKKILTVFDIQQLFIYIKNQENFNYYGLNFFIDKFLSLTTQENRIITLKNFIKIYDEISEHDEFIFSFYKWCQKYNIEKETYTLKRLENELKSKIHGLDSSDRIRRVETLIKIKKELNEDYREYLYFIRKYALSYGFRKDYQSELFMEYFKSILKKDYKQYIHTIYDYLYLEQFKQNEYTEKTTTLEEVLKEILEVVYLNSKSDLFNILEYFFQDKKYDPKKIALPSKLFLELLPNNIQNREDALISYSFIKMSTTLAYYNYFTDSDEVKGEKLVEELNKFDISSINILRDNVVDRDEYKEPNYSKVSQDDFIELLKEQKTTKNYEFKKSGEINANIEYYADIYFETKCEYQNLHLGGLLTAIPFMTSVDMSDANRLVLNYLTNLYSNVSQDIEPIEKKYNYFNIVILLEFLKKYFYCTNASSVASAIQSYVKIGEFYIDETVDFIIENIDYDNPFHTKIFLDILVELPLSKYTNLKKLQHKLLELFQESPYIYLDYSFKKIFKVLNIKNRKVYNYSFLELPQNTLLEADKPQDSFQRFFSTTEYQTTETFMRKLIAITDLDKSFLWEKVNYFKLKNNISINYHTNCSKGLKLLNFHTPFFEAEFIQWLYQEGFISYEQNDYLTQILQSYDLKVLKQENYKPNYIKTLPPIDYTKNNIVEYLNKISLEKIISNPSKIFSGYWQELINSNHLITINFNTVVINKRLFHEFKDDKEILEKFYFNFGIDSFYSKVNNIYYQTVDDFAKISLPIITSTYCFSSSFLQNSQLYYLAPIDYETKLIRWNYGDINTRDFNNGYGQINELKEPINILSNEKMIKFCRVEIQHTEKNKHDSRLFILEKG